MDSGAGGLSVFKEIRKVLPDEKYIYFSDNAHCPYGEKDPEYIIGRCRAIVDRMTAEGTQAVVIACNTATAAAISTLRSEYDIPFVGMEPAVKPAALGTRSGVIGVLATAGTLKASKYLLTRSRFEDDVTILEHVGCGFVELVENCELDGPHAEAVCERSLRPLLDAGADTIVLGCTHYPFLVDAMQKIAPRGIRFIDPAPAVASHLVDVMRKDGIALSRGNENGSPKRPAVKLMSSGDPAALEDLFNLIYPRR